ncbi:MAG: response regulator [Syntrophobacteraceae bacterium]|jgi:CheY-like chemotaxis protein
MPIPEQRIVVLVADDDEDDRVLIEEVIREVGIQCCLRFVRGGLELMDYLQHRPPFEDKKCVAPNLIILDLYMSYMDGIEALGKIRAGGPTKLIPVIIFSTVPDELTTFRAYALGANAVFLKPPIFDELKDAINAFSLFWIQYTELPTWDTDFVPGICVCGKLY